MFGAECWNLGTGGDVDEIAPRAGLAARQMHLQTNSPSLIPKPLS